MARIHEFGKPESEFPLFECPHCGKIHRFEDFVTGDDFGEGIRDGDLITLSWPVRCDGCSEWFHIGLRGYGSPELRFFEEYVEDLDGLDGEGCDYPYLYFGYDEPFQCPYCKATHTFSKLIYDQEDSQYGNDGRWGDFRFWVDWYPNCPECDHPYELGLLAHTSELIVSTDDTEIVIPLRGDE